MLLVVLVVGGVLPQVADLRQAIRLLGGIDTRHLAALALLASGALVVVWIALARLVGGVSVRQAGVAHLLSTAVANTVPAGGAVAVAVNLRVYASFGRGVVPTSQGLLAIGLLDNAVKVLLPLLAAALAPVLPGDLGVPPTVTLVAGVAAGGGIATVVVLLRSEGTVRRTAGWLGSVLRRSGSPETRGAWAPAAVGYQRALRGRLVAHGPVGGLALLAAHVLQAVLLVVALRAVGVSADQVGVEAAVIAYALMRLLTAVPVTPGGLGIAELGLLGGLGAVAGDETMVPVAAAVLLFRGLTYLLPIVLAAPTWLLWRVQGRSEVT